MSYFKQLRKIIPIPGLSFFVGMSGAKYDNNQILFVPDGSTQSKCLGIMKTFFCFVMIRIYTDVYMPPATKADISAIIKKYDIYKIKHLVSVYVERLVLKKHSSQMLKDSKV